MVFTDAGGGLVTERFYVNGVLVGTSAPFTSVTPSSQFCIGGFANGQNGFNGLIDNVRVFTFATGQFDVHDFLIPEPSVVGLVVMGGALAFARRRRR